MKYLGPISDPKDIVNKEYVDNNSGGDHIELTQLEYDALSQAEKENGTVYFVTDGEPSYTVINDSVPIGAIQAFGGSSLPYGWLFCDGSAVSRTEYSELFAAIRVTHGAGDGSTTFNLPDLRGRTLIGVGNSGATGSTNHTLGQKDGEEKTSYGLTSGYAKITGGSTELRWNYKLTSSYSTNWRILGSSGGGAYTGSGEDGATLGGTTDSGNNMQPYTVANYIIKARNTIDSTAIKELDPQSIIFNTLHPVGSYFETSDSSFDPNRDWSGTWALDNSNEYTESKKLLWTNPSVASIYAAATVSLNLSDYDSVDVYACHYTDNSASAGVEIEIGGRGVFLLPGSANAGLTTRTCDVSATGVTFSAGAVISGTTRTADNYAAIPKSIYGIKKRFNYRWHRIS